ncbi:MAG: GAF domain-containing protein [Chloroflexi bacterium]|nr:GAF domain-containing protein [Chloroflexota bacterium]MBP8054707.1 GAF domain-containing protein [Chloroflexota bacterium]
MSGERILVIDDSKEVNRHLSEQLLPTFGFKTLSAMDGRTGLDMILAEKPDLVMLDLNMPEMTGLDVLKALAHAVINIPVVLMTGYGSEKSAIEAFRLGIKDYLVKPFTVDEVVQTINRALLETRLRHDKEDLTDQLTRANNELRRQLEEMDTLFRIGKAVASALSVDHVMEQVSEASLSLANAEECTIWLLDIHSDRLVSYARSGDTGELMDTLHLAYRGTQLGEVMRTGRAVRLTSFSGEGIKIKTGYMARAAMYVPLIIRDKALGILSVSNRRAPRSFSERDEDLLSALADYAAIALENARVFQATDRALANNVEDLRNLMQITRTLTASIDLNEIVRMTIQQVHNSWRIEASSLWLVDREHETLRLLDNVGTPADVLRSIEIPLSKGFVGYTATTGKPIFTNDVATHPLHFGKVDKQTGFLTRSLLCVPLLYRNQVIGVLQLLNKLDNPFYEQDVEKARAIATAVAIAVNNALAYQQTTAKQQALEIMLTEKRERLAAAALSLPSDIQFLKGGLSDLFDNTTLTSKQRTTLQNLHQQIHLMSEKLDVILNETNPRPIQPPAITKE